MPLVRVISENKIIEENVTENTNLVVQAGIKKFPYPYLKYKCGMGTCGTCASLIISGKNNLPEEAEDFKLALCDDLDSPKALAIFFDWLRKTNKKLDGNKLSKLDANKGNNFISFFDSIYGVLKDSLMVPDDVLNLIEEREIARKNNDWAKSDNIRYKINKKGWIVKDTPNGPKIAPK